MKTRVALLGVWLVCSLTWFASSARAEDADYEGIVRNALSEFDLGHYEEAAALFEQAHAKSPSARTHRGLGLAYYEGRRYTLAVRNLREALVDQRRPLSAEQRADVQQTLHQAEGFVARFHVALQPSDAKLEVDGQRAEIQDGELLLDVGRHELIARAPGRAEDRRLVEARASSAPTDLEIELPQLAAPTPVAAAAVSATGSAPTRAKVPGIAPWIAMGAGGALLIGSAVTWMLANDAYANAEKKCPSGSCPGGVPSDVGSGKTLVTATDVLLVGGAVAVAAGATWWALASRGRAEPQKTAFLFCTAVGCSAHFRSRF